MCLIIDANVANKITSGDFRPVIDWLTGSKTSGRLAYGGRLAQELETQPAFRRLLIELQRAGRVRRLSSCELRAEEDAVISTGACVSNDQHVIALARLSGARTLASEDVKLHRDFKNQKLIDKPRGSVYQNPDHSHLLRHTPSCGVA